MGKWLQERGIAPDQLVTSTAVRAVETAKAVALELGYSGSLLLAPGLYLAAVRNHIEVISSLEADPASVLIVGHNPGISETASALSGIELDMPTAALAWIELDIDHFSELQKTTRGRLVQFQRPPQEEKGSKSSKKGNS